MSPRDLLLCTCIHTFRLRASSTVHVPRPYTRLDCTRAWTVHAPRPYTCLNRTCAFRLYTPLDRTRASSSAFVDGASSHATPLSPQVNCCLLRHFSILWVFMPFCKARPGDVNGESINSHLHKIENHAVGASAADDGRADGRSKSSGCSGSYRYVVFSTWTCTFCKLVFLFQEC